MANSYPGYCVDCGRSVRANHGELVKKGGKWVVSCGKSKSAATPKTEQPKEVAPEGMRLTDLRISSSNAALTVKFAVNGLGSAYVCAGYSNATIIQYTNGSNDALIANLTEQGRLHKNTYDSWFLLSAEEQAACSKLIADAKAELLSAILDGTAAINVSEVGCDYPHLQVCGVTLPGQEKAVEYALLQSLLSDLRLKVDGREECKDLAAAIRTSQAAQTERARKIQAHKERRAQGYHVVLVKRCWECGRTKILGELDDEMREMRMSPEVYAECVREQQTASLASVPAGTILSSVGFGPAPESKFDFRVIESDWYCGC